MKAAHITRYLWEQLSHGMCEFVDFQKDRMIFIKHFAESKNVSRNMGNAVAYDNIHYQKYSMTL